MALMGYRCRNGRNPPVKPDIGPMTELTQLLQQVQAGDTSAREALFAVTYPTLEKLARARLRDGGRNTLLDTRGVVHESYLRYVQGGTLRAEDRRVRARHSARRLEGHEVRDFAAGVLMVR
jgi:hypothetical protein